MEKYIVICKGKLEDLLVNAKRQQMRGLGFGRLDEYLWDDEEAVQDKVKELHGKVRIFKVEEIKGG